MIQNGGGRSHVRAMKGVGMFLSLLVLGTPVLSTWPLHKSLSNAIFSPSMEMSRLTRDGTAEPISRDQILRRERGQGNVNFPCSADHRQYWQPYPVDPYSCYMCDHTWYVVIFLFC